MGYDLRDEYKTAKTWAAGRVTIAVGVALAVGIFIGTLL